MQGQGIVYAERPVNEQPSTHDSLPTILLKPGEADRVVAGHPWVYESSILRLSKPAEDGSIVQVKDHRQRFLGVGFFNSKSRIRVRILGRERIQVDQAFFEQRLRAALAQRQKHMPKATSFRVVNAESDFLSGLIVDKYEDVLVVQTSSLGMDQRKGMIVAALQAIFAPRAILERNDIASRKFEGMSDSSEVLAGQPALEVTARINDLKFQVDLSAGHKTGFYLDQQSNYLRVAECARGGQVLDAFSFTGGFGLHAARAGASRVHLLDQSEAALAVARRNAEANGLAETCSFEAENVFDWFKARAAPKAHERAVPVFDLIILDPPSFTRNRAAIPDALRGYKEIHLRALRLLKPGGTLATFCCSHHVDAMIFQETILSAAFDAHRVLRRVASFSQGLDHPIIPVIPETEYLKGFAFEIAN